MAGSAYPIAQRKCAREPAARIAAGKLFQAGAWRGGVVRLVCVIDRRVDHGMERRSSGACAGSSRVEPRITTSLQHNAAGAFFYLGWVRFPGS